MDIRKIIADTGFVLDSSDNWALLGASDSGRNGFLDELLIAIGNREELRGKLRVAKVNFRHGFRTRSNTGDFYYQQRFNSSDSEDSATVREYLDRYAGREGYWNLEHVAHTLQLQELLDKELIKLSNGETKRVLVSEALLKNPNLLMLDNPYTGLDVDARASFDDLLSFLSGQGCRVIISTSAEEIPTVVQRVALFDKGGVVREFLKEDFHPKEFALEKRLIDQAGLEKLVSSYGEVNAEVVVKMQDVIIRYGEKTILDQVNWLVRPGERWALLGNNGAGKSTLLSLINGDNPQAYANDIVLFDRKRGSGESIWDIKRRTGFVSPELFQYFPVETSCFNAVESGFYDTVGLFRPSSEANLKTVKEWLRIFEIEQFGHKLLKQVPVYVQRLCLLARALVKNPALLILDEPGQGLDTEQQVRLKGILDNICEATPVTLVYVSHYASEIPDSVTKVIKLQDGKVVFCGSRDQC